MALGGLSVMVVEDHGFQRRMALRLLSEVGVQRVAEASDGESALALLQAMDPMPDVLVVDLDLPGMDGIQFIGHVAHAKLARAVVIASALDAALLNTVQAMTRAYGLRVLGCVEKPLTAPKLADVLGRFHQDIETAGGETPVEISAAAVREALERGEFLPWFQPQVEFANGRVMAVEALARWQRPDGSLVQPLQFIGTIEREGLVDALTDAILDQACAWKARWAREGLALRVAVNVSMLSLARVEAADRFQSIVRRHGVDPREVVLEITESAVMDEAAHALNVLARLRLKGFGLSIDDFGTGYSSLSQLAHIPFTELKIDQSFVGGACQQPRKRAVVEASLDLARKLGLVVVGEGVERTEEWQMLADLGCTYAQGFLISRPVPGEQIPGVVEHWRRPDIQ